MKITYVPSPPSCKNPITIIRTCVNGTQTVKRVGCGKINECDECLRVYRKKLIARILEGVRQHDTGRYVFGTLTYPDNPCICIAMARWKSLRRSLTARYGKWRFFRVVQMVNGRHPHIHFASNADFLPLVDAAYGRRRPGPGGQRNEAVEHWYDRQTPEAKAFINILRDHGFGLAHLEEAYRGGYGLGSYLAGYMAGGRGEKSKTKQLNRCDGRRVRVAEASRGWRQQDYEKQYLTGHQMVVREDTVPADTPTTCECCKLETVPLLSRPARRAQNWKAHIRERVRQTGTQKLLTDFAKYDILVKKWNQVEQAELNRHLHCWESEALPYIHGSQRRVKHRRKVILTMLRRSGIMAPVPLILEVANE